MGKPVGVQVPLRAPFEDPPGLNRQADFFMPDLNLFAAVFFLATAYYPLCRLAPGSLAYQGLLLFFLALLGACLWQLRRGPRQAQPPRGQAQLLALLQLPLVLGVFAFHAHVQWGRSQTGIQWLGPCLGLAVAGTLWLWSWRRPLGPAQQVVAAVLAGLALQVACLLTFKLGDFSDMLPLIQSAGRLLMAGQSPYSEVTLFPGEIIRTTYLPGLWLSYLPAVALGLDPRWLNCFFLAAFAYFFYQGAAEKRRPWAAALLVLFFANPWLTLRHEIYLPAVLWILAFVFWAQARAHPWLEAAGVGLLAASSQLGWPFAWIWLGWRLLSAERRTVAAAALVFAALVLPFALWDGPGMAAGIFGHWKGLVEVSHFNLYSWMPWPEALGAFQALSLLGCALWAWRKPALGVWPAALLATSLFFLGLFHVSHYFYFISLALLLFTWISHVDRN
jgi:hypothetical protein